MWMDAYVQHTLIRQQIAESDRAAALRHLLRSAKPPRPPSPWRAVVKLVYGATVATAFRAGAWRPGAEGGK